MTDNRTAELLRELRRTLEKCRRTEEAGFDTYWITAVALDTSLDEIEQAIAATLGEQIVRCGDCMSWFKGRCFKHSYETVDGYGDHYAEGDFPMDEHDFCSLGERRADA